MIPIGKKRPSKKTHKKNKKLTYLGMAGLILIIAAFILVADLRNNPSEITGHSVSINFLGVTKEGKMRTDITFKQPTLMNMGKIQGGTEARDSVANNIIQAADFTGGITKIYQNNPPAQLLASSLEAVSTGAVLEDNNFLSDTTCLKKTGENLGHWGTLQIRIVSELKYQRCKDHPTWLSAYVEHFFFNQEGNRFICRQGDEQNKLFLVQETSGKVSSDLTLC